MSPLSLARTLQGQKNLCFSIGINLYVTRARDNGDRSQKRKVGNVLKLENAAGTLDLPTQNPSGLSDGHPHPPLLSDLRRNLRTGFGSNDYLSKNYYKKNYT